MFAAGEKRSDSLEVGRSLIGARIRFHIASDLVNGKNYAAAGEQQNHLVCLPIKLFFAPIRNCAGFFRMAAKIRGMVIR